MPGGGDGVEYLDTQPEWTPTRALGRAVLMTGLLLIAGVLAGRVDLVVLAIPFALGTTVALHRRPRERPRIALEVDEGYLVEGAEAVAAVTVGNPEAPAYDLVVVRTRIPPWLRIKDGDRPVLMTLAPGAVDQVELRGEALRWGRHPLGPAAARAAACDGLMISRAGVAYPRGVKVYPVTEPFDADEAMPRAAGLVGGHRSRRPGEGGELAGVRVFQPGDRLRRVDWRVSLRARQLHVAATLSDRDAEVVLLLDVLAEAGRSGGVGGTASVLDTTVRAAAAIAEHYLHRGDRVSMLEYGTSARRLRPATGRRQYLTVLEWLLDVQAQPSPYEPYDQVFGPHLLSSDALVVVFTPLVDGRSAEMLARLARSGRFVLAVDTLPEGVGPPRRSDWTDVAHRFWRLERDNTIGQLREHGVPVVRWAGAGSLDLVLRDVARMASAPKGALR
ncbi:DUF58 domain-containing protein [Phytohabitans kaempferiae]|uniref:DUF58 domain-containing protein n=1 Tax=Phytohabitans kaempferiae TaxID=1620943 RepID=A0ABV6LV63_9ACTN